VILGRPAVRLPSWGIRSACGLISRMPTARWSSDKLAAMGLISLPRRQASAHTARPTGSRLVMEFLFPTLRPAGGPMLTSIYMPDVTAPGSFRPSSASITRARSSPDMPCVVHTFRRVDTPIFVDRPKTTPLSSPQQPSPIECPTWPSAWSLCAYTGRSPALRASFELAGECMLRIIRKRLHPMAGAASDIPRSSPACTYGTAILAYRRFYQNTSLGHAEPSAGRAAQMLRRVTRTIVDGTQSPSPLRDRCDKSNL
jgi:hypothetical protein